MVELQSTAGRTLRQTTLFGVVLVAGVLTIQPAFARHHHGGPHRARVAAARGFGHLRPASHIHVGGYVPPFSEYAVDGNSGRVLVAQDENALRHPASITKVMTLYLLFEELHRGQLSLDDRIPISVHAAAQAPTKLGLRPGSTIRIEDAVKAIVTKSANDMAVAIAERIGGDEATFAQMMTRKAHALGMSRSNFVNASGLPDDMQLTTAHDLVVLGRAIHDRYPQYFHFFSTPSFRYAGQFMPNHNHLMEQVEGMDGIKTGYTRSSGFNLLSSVKRNGHWLVSVVLGGRTRLGRDRIMANLIAAEIDKCATVRTAPVVAENPALEQVAEAIPVVQHVGEIAPPVENVAEDVAENSPPAAADDEGAPAVTEDAEGEAPHVQARMPIEAPVAAVVAPKTSPKVVREPVRVAMAAPVPTGRARPAFVPGLPQAVDRDMTSTGSIRPRQARLDGMTSHWTGAATATPSSLKRVAHRDRTPAPVKVASLDPHAGLPTARPDTSRGAWMLQIGATPTVAEANGLIAQARSRSHGALGGARPYTEKVQKGSATLFRARFAGLDQQAAASACRSLKHAGFSCFATRN